MISFGSKHSAQVRSTAAPLVLMVALAATALGCNQAQPPVNRVQPNVVDKAGFEGEWYFLQTVIDTPYTASYTFVGEQGNTYKIRWEIQEDYLIARRSHEHVRGSESEGIATGTEDGAAISMYRIESHFDVRRQYNPVTGEEQNVIVENTSDRPWSEREFMRIDWSENLITNNEFLVGARLFDGIQSEPVSYYVQEGDHPHAPKFETREAASGESELYYIDIVNKMFVRPTNSYIEGFGEIPTCYLYTYGHYDCAPGEITVRNSFLRVDEEREYQPFLYTGDRMDRFGYFVTESIGYNDQYGTVEPARFRFANRHNLWQTSYRRGADGEYLSCTAATEAEVCGGAVDGGGSVCDTDWARAHRSRNEEGEWLGRCTIPYRTREVRQVAYHVSNGFPEELLPDARHLIGQWNGAFVSTVASLRENECLAQGWDEETCAAERDRDSDVVVLCQNPVVETDHSACGPAGTSAQIGDLRQSLLGWVTEPHVSSPLGYGPSSADSETGELIMGNAFVYGAPLETLTAFARDIVALLNGDISEADVRNADVVRDWVESRLAPGDSDATTGGDEHVIPVDPAGIQRIDEAMNFEWAHGHDHGSHGERPSGLREFSEQFEESLRALERSGALGNGAEQGSARLHSLRGTDIERLLSGAEMRLAAGIDPRAAVTDQAVASASPLQGMSLDSLRAIQRAHQMIEQEACMVRADFVDEGLVGLARAIQRAASEGDGTMEWYGETYSLVDESGSLDYELVREMLIHPIFDAVTAHEVGHTIGLRHNFSGSFDAMNYHPRYWELRDDGDMQPRNWDPMTEAERDGRINEYQYSTVMDYGNNFVVTDAVGIGHYDHAAVKMGYGDMVEVFTDAVDPNEMNWLNFMFQAGWPVPLRLEAFTGGEVSAYAYTDYPGLIGGRERLERRADVPYTSLQPDRALQFQGIDDPLQDAQGRPAVPYLFCSDEQADLNPDCMRYDSGADAYESLSSVVDNYWNYYIFNAFRRGRLGFSTESYANRILGRYFEKLQRANQIYSLYRGVFEDIFSDSPGYDEFWTRPDGMGPWTAGVGVGFQLLTRVVTTPEPGSYARGLRGDGVDALINERGPFNVSAFEGRALETTWNFDAGYFWFDQLERAGFFYDKSLALMVLTDPNTSFVGRDTASDQRRYQISFYSSFSDSLRSLMRGVLSEDWTSIAPRLDTGSGELSFPDPLQLVDGDMPGIPLDPNTSFSIQLFASVYGMSMIPETFDQSYMNSARIFVRGGAEGVDIDSSVPVVEFTNLESGLTYVAVSDVGVDGEERGVGARMLSYAQVLSDRGSTTDLRKYMDNIDLVRRLSWHFGLGRP